ncbi:hypothetical protein PG990_000150 [Apiospora arundinis]
MIRRFIKLSPTTPQQTYTRFSNIRYVQAPTGQLRFRAPLPPLEDRTTVQDGAQYRTCPQGILRWQANGYIPIGKYTGPCAPPFSLETWERDIATSQPPPGLLETINDNTSEDCLFLDVHVHRRAFETRGLSTTKREGTGKKGALVVVAPVGH